MNRVGAIDFRVVREHTERIRPLLVERHADGILLFTPANILGFSGAPLGPSDRIVCGLVSGDGEAALVCPAFEAPDSRSIPPQTRVFAWLEDQSPYEAIAKAVKHLGLERGTILLDPAVWIEVQRRLAQAMPGATWREDDGAITSVRQVKSPLEVEAIARACRRVGQIYAEIGKRLSPGMTELELAGQAVFSMGDGSLSGALPLAQSGPNAAIPHRPTSDRALSDGDCLVVDYVLAVAGYHGDMTRTFAVGRPREKCHAAYQAVRAAQRAAIEAARPGATCESVDAAARSVIEKAGFGAFFVHRLGHGIGLDCHEAPFFVQGNRTKLAPGMCLTIEPGVYVPGEFGVRIEDVVAITENGCRILSDGVPTDVSEAFSQGPLCGP